MPQLTKEQARVVNALRKGTTESLKDLDDEKQDQKLVAVKALDVVTLLDVIDAAYPPPAAS